MSAGFLRAGKETRAFQIISTTQTTFPWTSAPQFSLGYSGFLLDIELVDITAGTNLTFTIQYYDEASRTYKTLLAGAAITADATHQRLIVSPDVPAAANLVAQVPAPRQWQIVLAQTGGVTSAQFQLGVTYFK